MTLPWPPLAIALFGGWVFWCPGCRRIVSAEHGASDDMPDHCDDCWCLAHPEAA